MSPMRRLRAIFFDAGNTLLRMDYPVIAEHLAARGYAVGAAQVEEAELRARGRLDPHLAPGGSTESTTILGRYLRYVLEHLGITGEAEVEDIARWQRGYNPPVGLWNQAEPEAEAALLRVKAAGLVAGVISNSNGSRLGILGDGTTLPERQALFLESVVCVEKPDPR